MSTWQTEPIDSYSLCYVCSAPVVIKHDSASLICLIDSLLLLSLKLNNPLNPEKSEFLKLSDCLTNTLCDKSMLGHISP